MTGLPLYIVKNEPGKVVTYSTKKGLRNKDGSRIQEEEFIANKSLYDLNLQLYDIPNFIELQIVCGNKPYLKAVYNTKKKKYYTHIKTLSAYARLCNLDKLPVVWGKESKKEVPEFPYSTILYYSNGKIKYANKGDNKTETTPLVISRIVEIIWNNVSINDMMLYGSKSRKYTQLINKMFFTVIDQFFDYDCIVDNYKIPFVVDEIENDVVKNYVKEEKFMSIYKLLYGLFIGKKRWSNWLYTDEFILRYNEIRQKINTQIQSNQIPLFTNNIA